ncbi:MAG: HDOD domain-containing protein [Nitrospirae bacterium]|nr:MAG: HDOD domain-containing protein [Nitrospirota bacterium]
MTPDLLQRVKNCKTLPTIPALPLQVLQLCRNEDTDIKRLAELISKDPTFVAKILNVANSSFFGNVRHKVATVTQAITLLGMNSVATLAFCFSLYRDLRRHGRHGFDHARYWRRSLLASVSGRVMGRWLKRADCEEIFLAALLQDLGMLVLSETEGQTYGQLIQRSAHSHQRLVEVERETLGADHAEVGAWLVEQWQLPELLQVAIRCSHDPLQAEVPESFQPIVKCVAVSGRLADIWCDPQMEHAIQEAAGAAHNWLGVDGEAFDSILVKTAEGFLEVAGLFQMDLGNTQDMQSVLERARHFIQTTASA